MANKKSSKPTAAPKNVSQTLTEPKADLFERFDLFLGKYSKFIFWGIFGLVALMVIGLFEMKIGLANDDALYIEAGNNYANGFFSYFYKATAPLYSMVVGILISIFGPKLVVLKAFSSLFFMVSLFLMYRAYRNRIPNSVLFAALFITGTNYLFLIHAALTYTECFFAMLQMFFMWAAFNLIERLETEKFPWKNWIIFGASVGLLYMTRNVSAAAIISVLAYFMLFRQWRNVITALLFGVFFIMLYESLKYLIWDLPFFSQFSNQGGMMVRKDIFNPADPNNTAETSIGFFARFWGNTEVYIGGRFWELLGIAKENGKMEPVSKTALTLFTLIIFLPGLIFSYIRKNKFVLISCLYFGALSAATYFGIHVYWAQARLIMIYFPFIFIMIFYGWRELFRTKIFSSYKIVWFLIVGVFLIPNFIFSIGKIPANLRVLSKNASGDEFYGYTPDWKNFFEASRYCARQLPEGSFVASRRAPMSYVYGDFKDFYPVYSLHSNDPDSLLLKFKENKVTHVLLSELRVNPKRYIPGRYINTLHRYVMVIAQKYPNVFRLVHKVGAQEVSEIYEIRYEFATPEYINPQYFNSPVPGTIQPDSNQMKNGDTGG